MCEIFYDDAVELLYRWQTRLGLTDWKIELRINCKVSETNGSGYTEWDEVNKAAVIWILDPEEYGERLLQFDFEETLIHELLHLKFALLQGAGDFQDRYVHVMIEEFARLLKRLDKGELND